MASADEVGEGDPTENSQEYFDGTSRTVVIRGCRGSGERHGAGSSPADAKLEERPESEATEVCMRQRPFAI